MSSYRNTFHFMGELFLPNEKAKQPFYQIFKNERGQSARLNFGIKESDHNMGFVEAFGSQNDTIKTMSTDNEKIEVPWDDRFDEEVVKQVANYKKFTVNLGDEYGGRNDFITQYDMIEFLHEWLPKYKGRVYVTGQFNRNPYKDKFYNHFSIENVYGVADDDDRHNRLGLLMDIYYNNESFDKADMKDSGKGYLNGYLNQYIDKDNGLKFVPMDFVFNASVYDMDNEKQKKLYEYKMKYLDIKNKKIMHIPWEIVMINGAEEKPFDESMLTNAQHEQVELGLKVVDDFRPRGSIFGSNIKEFRLFLPKLTGNFVDGMLQSDFNEREFEDNIYVPIKDEKIDDVVKASKESKNEKKLESKQIDESDLDESSLF